MAGAERLLQLADRGVAVPEPVEQLDPHRLAENPEALRDELNQRLRERMRRRRKAHIL